MVTCPIGTSATSRPGQRSCHISATPLPFSMMPRTTRRKCVSGLISPKTCAHEIEEFLSFCELDGLMLIFPDSVEGLKMFGTDILPSRVES